VQDATAVRYVVSGLEFLRTVQASLPDVPAIVVAGTHEGSRTKTEAGRLAVGYLRKPVDVTRLKGLVQAAMEQPSHGGHEPRGHGRRTCHVAWVQKPGKKPVRSP
jgi:DNA-binding NtrC family response regulator